VEALVVTAAALLLVQLIFGHCKRRWHYSFVRGVLLVRDWSVFLLCYNVFGADESTYLEGKLDQRLQKA
jgi:hypothetical protein